MFDFLNKPYPFTTDLKYSLKLAFGLAIGIFIFILFFQPFELNNTDFNSYILTVAGFSGITLLLISLLKIILPWAFEGLFQPDSWDMKRELFLLFLIWVLNSVAFAFYLAYVGRVPVTIYLAFKIALTCLVLPVMMMLINEIQNLKTQVLEQRYKIRELEDQLGNFTVEQATVELHSDNRSDKLLLKSEALILVRSAENYVEIIYRENHLLQKKLLRSTMKSIEDQLRSFSEMVRCHRTCIINAGAVIRLKRTAQGYRLSLAEYHEEIPVSRQYLLAVKAVIDKPDLTLFMPPPERPG